MKPMNWKNFINWIVLALWLGLFIGGIGCAVNGTEIPALVSLVAIFCCMTESAWDVLVDYATRLNIELNGDEEEED